MVVIAVVAVGPFAIGVRISVWDLRIVRPPVSGKIRVGVNFRAPC